MLNGNGGKSGDGFSLGSSSGSDIGNPSSWSSRRVHNEQDSTNSGDGAKTGDNTNPYKGPVDQPVVVVDEHGNATPVNLGEYVEGSPGCEYQQVLGPGVNPAGDCLDRGGHRNQNDPRAQEPHGHRLGVATPDGNPHLPIYH